MSYEVLWIMLLKPLIVYYSAQTLNIFVKWKNKWRSEVKSGQKSLEVNRYLVTCAGYFALLNWFPLKVYCVNLCFTISRNMSHGFIAFFTEVRSIFVLLRTLLFFRAIIFIFNKALHLNLKLGTIKDPGPFPLPHPLTVFFRLVICVNRLWEWINVFISLEFMRQTEKNKDQGLIYLAACGKVHNSHQWCSH